MAQQGGYRKPENPAPVSGPGALSRRTDGGPTQGAKYMPGMPYGENTMSQQTAAPMAGKAEPAPMEMPTPLGAATMRPNEPITNGIDMGPGAGSEALGLPTQEPTLSETIRKIAQYDNSGEAEMLYAIISEYGY